MIADLDLSVERGERVLLAGPSGAGKSTLLLAVAGALGEAVAGRMAGEVQADGQLGLMLQNPGNALVAERVGREIAFGPENVGLARDEIARRVRDVHRRVRLEVGTDHPVAALSGGQAQRLALAGILALEPQLLLLDEPTSMLDPLNAAAVRSAVVDVVTATGATMIVVEHHLEPWLEHVDRVVVLDEHGSIAADTEPGRFVSEHRSGLGAAGVWMPGLPDPWPTPVAEALTAPDDVPGEVATQEVSVLLARRGLRASQATVALKDVDAQLRAGSLTAVSGPSGAGKSTFVAVAGGLITPTSGRVTGYGRPPHRLASRALASRIGWVPQNPEHGLLASTVAEEVSVTASAIGRRVDVEAVLAHLGLEHLAGVHPFRLSGGEQRRLALAAALAHRPGVVLLDEPTVGQDRTTWSAVMGWVASAAAAGGIVACSTHDDLVVALAGHQVRLAGGART